MKPISRRSLLRTSAGLSLIGVPGLASAKAISRERRCEQNLRAIYDAVTAYKQERGKLPARLTELFEQGYIDSRLLICPILKAKGKHSPSGQNLIDHLREDQLTSYIWEYVPGSPTRDLHERQQLIGAGDWVPIVRCREHSNEENGHSVLNLSMGGAIYSSKTEWEFQLRHIVPFPYLYASSLIGAKNIVPLRDRILARSPDSTDKNIDLTGAFNASLADPWPEGWKGEEAIDLLKKGGDRRMWKIEDIGFEIRGCVQIEGKSAAAAHEELAEPRFPFAMRTVKLDLKSEKLQVLCGSIGSQPGGTKAAKLRVTDDSGGTEELVLEYGRNVADRATAVSSGSSELAWSRKVADQGFKGVRSVWRISWKLRERRPLVKVEFESTDAACYPFLLAITAG